MEHGNSPDLVDVVTRRDYLFRTGSIAVLGATAGCLGLGGNEQQAGESENDPGDTDSEEGNEDDELPEKPDREQNADGDEAESSADLLGNEFEDGAAAEEADEDKDGDTEDDDSILEEESDGTDSEEESEDDVSPEQPEEDDDNDENESSDGAAENGSEDDAGEDDSESDQAEEDSDGEEGDEDGRFEQYRLEELAYQVDYPTDWVVNEGDDYVKIHNDDETAWLWIEIREARTDLDREVRHFREDFEPDPSVEFHADDSVALSSGEDGHRFIIEMTERERTIFAHELIAQASGYQYRTVVVIERSVYTEEYAQLAEEILATVALR